MKPTPAETGADDWDSAETETDDPFREAERFVRRAHLALRQRDLLEATWCANEALALALLATGTDERRADVLQLTARLFRELGDLERCEIAARAAVVAEARCERPLVLGQLTLFLAHVLHERGNYDEATAAARWAYHCYVRAKGPRNPETRAMGALLDGLARPRARDLP